MAPNGANRLWLLAVRAGTLSLLAAATCRSFGQGLRLESAGTRFGFHPAGLGGTFFQAEAFLNWELPWTWDLGTDWRLESRLDVSAGWLGESSVNAGIATAGPSLLLRKKQFPLSLEVGSSATVLTREDFPGKDFGIPLQFTSHAGLNWDVTSRIRLGYRFQHMSNAGFAKPNPGLNLHVFSVSYLF